MAFSREHVLLKHNGGATLLAYPVFVEGYQGDRLAYDKDVSRNLDSELLVVRATANTREFVGRIWLDSGATGTVTYDAVEYTLGTPAQLKTAIEDTDLECKAFDDSDFWDAENLSAWDPHLESFGGSGTHRVQALRLVER